MTNEELDWKVAEALGLEPVSFRPSTDWNDAMFAAEKAGLLKRGIAIFHHGPEYSIVDQRNMEIFQVWILDKNTGNPDLDHTVSSESGPKAICLAILALKETT